MCVCVCVYVRIHSHAPVQAGNTGDTDAGGQCKKK